MQTRHRRSGAESALFARPGRARLRGGQRDALLLATTLRYRVNGGHSPARLPDFRARHVASPSGNNRLGLCMKVYKKLRPSGISEQEHLAALISASKRRRVARRHSQEPSGWSRSGDLSSRRGVPQALLELTSWAGRGYDLAVDAPMVKEGPRHVVQDGVMTLAQITGLPIIPYSCRLGWKIQVKSWDPLLSNPAALLALRNDLRRTHPRPARGHRRGTRPVARAVAGRAAGGNARRRIGRMSEGIFIRCD